MSVEFGSDVLEFCNHQKSYQHPYNEYIHPYYLMNLKGKIFLVARIQPVDESLDITFSFDKKVIGNEELYNQFVSHWRNMDLDNRLRKSAISFLHNGVLTYLEEVKGLSVSIDILLLRFGKIYGLNDWRTAIVRALSEKLKGKDSTAVMAALASMRPQISDINI